MGKDKKEKKKKDLSGKQPKLSNKEYEAEITKLHAELVKLQYWVQAKGLRIIVLFEGRDAAGKGGVIKRITERVSPRVFRVVALPTPSEREKTQMYIQRYMSHFPAAGEVVIFDRSWYNRAGVERVMGFCTDKEYVRFLQYVPEFEHFIQESGMTLIKYWLDTSMEEQEKRFKQRINDPRKIWKLSPMDVESYRRWYDYSQARDSMFLATNTDSSPWYIVPADDKKRARLNCISHFLSLIPYEDVTPEKVELGKRDMTNKYDDTLSDQELHFVPQKY
ncbi:MAG: polyphosphate kinase 2 [Xenococcus sp. MO_188.B8]|nr:polyphosphate kinase 2 [Xenococcus sp. MO_188.B8]